MRKNKLFATILLSVFLICCTGCGNQETTSTPSSAESGDIASVGESTEEAEEEIIPSEDYYVWDGNLITGLTEEGATQTALCIPERCEGFTQTIFSAENISVTKVIFESDKNISMGVAFAENTTIKEVILPAELDEIPEMAFYNCTALESIIVPPAATYVMEYAFAGATALKQVTFEGTFVAQFCASSFQGCTSLTQVDLPESLGYIYTNAFNGCTSLETITLPKQIQNISNKAFSESGLKNIYTNPETENCIFGESAFAQEGRTISVTVEKDSYIDQNFDTLFVGDFEKLYY